MALGAATLQKQHPHTQPYEVQEVAGAAISRLRGRGQRSGAPSFLKGAFHQPAPFCM